MGAPRRSFLHDEGAALAAPSKGFAAAAASRSVKERPASERGGSSRARGGRRGSGSEDGDEAGGRGSDTAIRPERFARLVTLASILIHAGRAGEPVSIADVCERLQISVEELHEDVNVLNVVNFGGGHSPISDATRNDQLGSFR